MDKKVQEEKRVLGATPITDVANQVSNITYGTSLTNSETNVEYEDFRSAVASMVKKAEEGFNGDFMQNLKNYYGENNDQGDAVKQILDMNKSEDGLDSNLVGMAYMSYNNNLQRMKDIDLVSRMIPQLSDALDTIIDGVLAADNSKGIVAFNVLEADQYKRVEDIDSKYEFYNKLYEVCRNAIKFGYGYALVVPYKDAFEKFKMNDPLYRRAIEEKNKKPDRKISESCNVFEMFEGVELNEDESAELKSLQDSTTKFLEHIVISEGAHHLCEFDNPEEISMLQEVMSVKNAFMDKMKGNKPKKKAQTNDGFKDVNNQFSFNNDVTGAVFKVIDTTKIIPIRVEDTNIGYYYVEDTDMLEGINTNMSDPLSALRTRATNDPQAEAERLNGMYFKKLADTITNSLVHDKKFLKNNTKFKEELYAVLKYGNMINKSLKITFIPAHQIVEFGNGESVIARSLWYSKLYLAILTTNIALKTSRGYDKRVYYVKSAVPAEVSQDTTQAIAQIKKDSRSITVMSSVNKILNIAGRTPDLFVPVDQAGNKAIDVDVISGQDITLKDELLEFLEDRMLGAIVPTPMLQAQTEVDYAKSIDTLNIKQLRGNLKKQRLFNPSINIAFNKLNAADMGLNVEDDEYEVIEVVLLASSALNVQSMNEQVGNSKDLVDILTRSYTDNGEYPPEAIGIFTRKLFKKFCPNIPHDEIDIMFQDSLKEAKIDAIANPKDEDTDA